MILAIIEATNFARAPPESRVLTCSALVSAEHGARVVRAVGPEGHPNALARTGLAAAELPRCELGPFCFAEVPFLSVSRIWALLFENLPSSPAAISAKPQRPSCTLTLFGCPLQNCAGAALCPRQGAHEARGNGSAAPTGYWLYWLCTPTTLPANASEPLCARARAEPLWGSWLQSSRSLPSWKAECRAGTGMLATSRSVRAA